MTLHLPIGNHEQGMRHRHDLEGCITWEPQLTRTHMRRRSVERATVIDVSRNGALVRARANAGLTRAARISIGLQSHRGLVAVRSIDPTADVEMSDYGVQFLWLDPVIQAFFDAAVTTESLLDFEWR